MPDDSYQRDEYLKVCEFLNAQGFGQYEVSNFATPGYESIHNLAYWQYKSVAALGPNATGLLPIKISLKGINGNHFLLSFKLKRLDKKRARLKKCIWVLGQNLAMILGNLLWKTSFKLGEKGAI